ncbi:M23 family metallopeptidase [Micromonospora sp. DT41]|uniref:M23 family metallopeptidase n=1 Tax=Micromonospora sp. DT41 TaxID=3393437 RepID=UPI003CED2080
MLESYYSTTSGYGNTIVIGHGGGWRTRYAHLDSRAVAKGATVKRGTVIGRVGATSAKYNLSPHLHYEQIHNGSVVVAVVQGVKWPDGRKANQKSTNNC